MEGNNMNKKVEDLLNRKEIKMIPFLGELASIKARAYNTPIAYLEDGKIVHEYPDGKKIYVKNINID